MRKMSCSAAWSRSSASSSDEGRLHAEGRTANRDPAGTGIDRFGAVASARTIRRLRTFIRQTVGHYPRTSRYHANIDAFETWVPGTPFIVYYRLEDAGKLIRVVAVFLHGKDRSDFVP
jgi:plasmid stabilization system protein ParE